MIPVAINALRSPGPSAPTIATASTSGGKAMSTSTTRMRKTSHLPPRNPALSPRSAPMPTEINAAKIPAASDTRAPQITRASMSRPTWSVPSGWSPDWNGDNSRTDVSSMFGSAIGSSGARMAANATSEDDDRAPERRLALPRRRPPAPPGARPDVDRFQVAGLGCPDVVVSPHCAFTRGSISP